jgi:hypothetical protein
MSYLSLFRGGLLVIAGLACASFVHAAGLVSSPGQPVAAGFGQLPLRFEANAGQTDAEARFLARGHGFTLFLTRGEAVLALREPDPSEAQPGKGKAKGRQHNFDVLPKKNIQFNLRMSFAGANRQAEIVGAEEQSGPVSYFIGDEPGRWRTGLPSYSRVLYREIYPATDLLFYGREGELEYDFIVRPGGDPAGIMLEFSGADSLALTDAGDLIVQVGGGFLRWRAPVAYQEIDGMRQAVQCAFTHPAADRVGFSVGGYDASQPLTIDPLLVYSTYLGGALQDIGRAIAVDRGGNVFVTGQSSSLNFPTNRAFRGTNSGGADVFVARLNTNASAFLYSTYVGGSNADIGFGIAVDVGGNAYVAGTTESGNFPTRNPVQSVLKGSSDAFLFKLGTNGTNLIYSTYFGGNYSETAYAVAVDGGTNNAYIAGGTGSDNKNDFPSAPSFQSKFGNSATYTLGSIEGFVARFNTSSSGNSSLPWWSWLGGNDDDIVRAITVDGSNGVYVTGETTSCSDCGANFPVLNALQPTFGGWLDEFIYVTDAFVTKIHTNGNSMIWSTYLGGTSDDVGYGIALDASNNVFVAGSTSSTNFPVTNAFQSMNGGAGHFFVTDDAFLVKIRANGGSLAYGTYLGGDLRDEAQAVAVDIAGNAWLTGLTFSADDFPTNNVQLQAGFGGDSDAFATMINPNVSGSNSLLFSTYLGGRGQESGFGIAVDTNANCYIVGQTSGTNSSSGVVQPNYGGGTADAFVTKIFASPLLQLSRSGTNHIATWPVFPYGFAPEWRTNVGSGSWSNLAGTITTNNGMNRLTVTNTGPRKFIRLRKP